MKIEIRCCATRGRSAIKATSPVALIKERLGIDAAVEPDASGPFDVIEDGEAIASRGGSVVTRILFGAGFPDLETVVDKLERRASVSAASV